MRRAKSPLPPVPQPPISSARHGWGTQPLLGAWWKSCEGSKGKVSFQHTVVWCLILKVISFVLSNLIPAFVLLSHTRYTSNYCRSITAVTWLQCNPRYICISARSLPLYIKHTINWAFSFSFVFKTNNISESTKENNSAGLMLHKQQGTQPNWPQQPAIPITWHASRLTPG